jgi:hypothetical protein
MLKRYNDFITENKSTMRIFYSDNFRNILKKIKDKANISKELLDSEDNYTELDVYTAIDITDKNDMISYIQVSRLERLNKTGGTNIHKIPDVDLTAIRASVLTPDAWKNGRTPYYSIGRWVRHIFVDVKKMSISNTDLENFVDEYKRVYLSINNIEADIELLSGEEIRKWYLKDNYEDGSENTTLGKSCMRYERCQEYFDIYVKNPDVCKLLILKSNIDPSKIRARALLWTIDNLGNGYENELYLDRIYYVDKEDIEFFYKWCKKNKVKFVYDNYAMGNDVSSLKYNAKVQLGEHTYETFPYIDTFGYYDPEDHRLVQDEDYSPDVYKVQQTDGTFIPLSERVFSEREGDYLHRDDAEYCEDINDWLPNSDAIYLEYKDIYVSNNASTVYSKETEKHYYMDDSDYSECMDDWLCSEDDDIEIVWFKTNSSEDQDCCIKDNYEYYMVIDGENYSKENYFKDPYTGEYHFKDEEIDGKEYGDYLEDKLKEDLNIGNADVRSDIKKLLLDYEPTDEFLDEISTKFENYIDDEYSSEYLLLGVYTWLTISDKHMRNQNFFREKFRNEVWNFINLKYEDEDEISNIKKYYIDKFPVGQAYGFKRCGFFINRLYSIDYSKLPVEIYKRILYLEL